MKSRFFNYASLASAIIHTSSNLSVATDASFSNNLRGNGNEQHVNRPRVLQKEEEVIFLESEFMPFMDDYSITGYDTDRGNLRKLQGQGKGIGKANAGRPKRIINVEFDDGRIFQLKNLDPKWRKEGKGKNKMSGRDFVRLPVGAVVYGTTVDLKGGEPGDAPTGGKLFDRRDFNLREARTPAQESNLAAIHEGGRRLQAGDRTVLAVRVVMNGGAQYSSSMDFLRDKVFGTGTDLHNLKSQYKACSYDKMNLDPTPSRTITDGSALLPGDESTDIVDGVVTIRIDRDVVMGRICR